MGESRSVNAYGDSNATITVGDIFPVVPGIRVEMDIGFMTGHKRNGETGRERHHKSYIERNDGGYEQDRIALVRTPPNRQGGLMNVALCYT